MSDKQRDDAVVAVAERDLACPHGVHLNMTFYRRVADGASLRYLVEGCGIRALYAEDCKKMDACEYAIVSRATLAETTSSSTPIPYP